jgi:3-oxoacyl-(acyl-carrier-protein) synthase/malonyl CoA-acyl carrier protein transacylase
MAEVAIVGLGAVFPGAGDAAMFWRNIRAGVDAISEVPKDRWDPDVYYRPGETREDRFYCRRGGFVDDFADFDPAAFGIMPAALHGIEPDQLLMLRAAAEAISDCGTALERERTGVIIGRGGYLTPVAARLDQRVHSANQIVAVLRDLVPGIGEERLEAVRAAFCERISPDGEQVSIGLVPNFAASRIANRFDLRGPAYTVDAACASSLVAVDHAVRELDSGRCDAVLAGGVHICHHPALWSVFTQMRALSPGEQIRPFDSRADGTLLSEGAGVVLLKRLEAALRDGDRIYAVIRGVGVSSDGRATSLMSPLAEGQELAIRRAWAAAGLDPAAPDALGLLEAHGTATRVGDEVELTALARVFGPRGSLIGLGTVKSMIGHAMPAAGIAGLIKAALAVHHRVLPPTLHISDPHPALARTRFEPVTEERSWPATVVRRAAVSAFGFGGINAHVILEAPRETAAVVRAVAAPPEPRPDGGPAEVILRLASDSPASMAQLLAASDADLLARADQEPGPGPCRLAIVAPDPRKLALARKIASRGTPWRGRSDIWFSPSPLIAGPEQVAFLFPGFEPEFVPRIEGVAERFGLPAPRLHRGGAGAEPGAEIVEFALDVVAVQRLLAGALAELGVTPGVLAGHSLGEWTAMVVGGIYPAIDEFIASLRPGMVEVPDVVYAALGASADRVNELAQGSPDVVITHDNCPHQSVVCGPDDLIAGVVARAREQGILAQTLPFRSGFHSPMFAPYLAAAEGTFRRLEVRPATVPVWSAASLGPYPAEPDGMRDLVLRHLVEPVRFRQLIEALHDRGVRAFVQVGPGSLTGFTDDTLAGREHLTVTTAVTKRDGLAQLRRAAAALWADGLSPRFHRLASPGGRASRGARSSPGVRLRLGTPLVGLDGLALDGRALDGRALDGRALDGLALDGPALDRLALSPAGLELPPGSPALAEFGALMAETVAAAGTVARSLTSEPGPQPGSGRPGGSAGGPPPGPVDEVTTTREFSLRTMPDIADHCLIPQAEGWPDDTDRFPVVPMTTLLEVLADAALMVSPGAVVVGFEQVTAGRWLTVAPPATVPVRAVREGPDRVRVRIEGYAGGTVLTAGSYPAAPPAWTQGLRGHRPPPVTARELYTSGWMFHGPRFAGVAEIESVADDGITGTLVTLPARGALLDSAGQLIGHWLQVSATVDRFALPTAIHAIRLYGPQPPDGERLAATGWIRELTDEVMRSDAELRTGDGQVWCRIEGWVTRRFRTDDAFWKVKMEPDRNAFSEPGPDGWNVVREHWADTASRQMVMRRYLNSSERAHYERLNPRQQREWLLRAVVVKDTVRRWLWDRGAGPIYPAEVSVEDSAAGVRVRGPFRAPRVSVASRPPDGPAGCWAVAIAGDEAVDFTIDQGDDGRLFVTQPGRAPRPIDAQPINTPALAEAS